MDNRPPFRKYVDMVIAKVTRSALLALLPFLLAGCQSPVVLRLDNGGGFAYGGYAMTFLRDGTWKGRSFTDDRSQNFPEHSGRYVLNAKRDELYLNGSREPSLVRIIDGNRALWLSPDEVRLFKEGGPKAEQVRYMALRQPQSAP